MDGQTGQTDTDDRFSLYFKWCRRSSIGSKPQATGRPEMSCLLLDDIGVLLYRPTVRNTRRAADPMKHNTDVPSSLPKPWDFPSATTPGTPCATPSHRRLTPDREVGRRRPSRRTSPRTGPDRTRPDPTVGPTANEEKGERKIKKRHPMQVSQLNGELELNR